MEDLGALQKHLYCGDGEDVALDVACPRACSGGHRSCRHGRRIQGVVKAPSEEGGRVRRRRHRTDARMSGEWTETGTLDAAKAAALGAVAPSIEHQLPMWLQLELLPRAPQPPRPRGRTYWLQPVARSHGWGRFAALGMGQHARSAPHAQALQCPEWT